jgi:hydrogenase-4 component B
MQVTASSFADGPVSAFRWALWPFEHRPRVRGLFPAPTRYDSHVADPVLDRALAPGLGLTTRALSFLRVVQSGQLPVYLLYVLLALMSLLVWMVV